MMIRYTKVYASSRGQCKGRVGYHTPDSSFILGKCWLDFDSVSPLWDFLRRVMSQASRRHPDGLARRDLSGRHDSLTPTETAFIHRGQ